MYLEARYKSKLQAIEFFVRDTHFEHCVKKHCQLTLEEARDFLLDGGCFVLMRYLVNQQFVGSFATRTMLITGSLLYR